MNQRNSTKRNVKIDDFYACLERRLRSWIKSQPNVKKITVVMLEKEARKIAKDMKNSDFGNRKWCRTLLERIKNEIMEASFIESVRREVTGYTTPIGRVPLDAVGCLAKVSFEFSSERIFSVYLSCLANGRKLPPMIVTNVPMPCRNEVQIFHREDALKFDSVIVIKFLNTMWSLRHCSGYLPYSLIITNIVLSESVKKLFKAAATDTVQVPAAVEKILHPLEDGIVADFKEAVCKKHQHFINMLKSETLEYSTRDILDWVYSAWNSFSSAEIIIEFQRIGIYYEEVVSKTRFVLILFYLYTY